MRQRNFTKENNEVEMKRLWLVGLAMALVMVFSASSWAVDLKVSGSFSAAGVYLDKINLKKEGSGSGQSTAFYYQRLRLKTEFLVTPGLSFVTSADIMERAWGANRSTPSATVDAVGIYTTSAATRAENENIGFDHAYVNYATPIGIFRVGYMPDYIGGTIFHDNETPAAKITYTLPVNNVVLGIQLVKVVEKSYNATNTSATQTDHDTNKVQAFCKYKNDNFEGGLIWLYANDAANRRTPDYYSIKSRFHSLQPYLKATIGPVKIQAELDYYFGKLAQLDSEAVYLDQKLSSLAGWLDAVATFGPVYLGYTFAYSQGQGTDGDTVNAYTGGGKDWSPTLIMWNSDRSYWIGNINGYGNGTSSGTSRFGTEMTNAFFHQLKIGLRPTDQLDICLSGSYARADRLNGLNATQTAFGPLIGLQDLSGYSSKDYGTEIDLTGTYKINDNLTYMAGFGYLFTGDYFKANNANADVANDYMFINKLTLTF
jgi:hypothetical protein